MACRCDDCTAAMGMFSAKDLIAVSSSKVDFQDGKDENGNYSTVEAKPTVAVTKKPEAPPPAATAAAAEPSVKPLKPWQMANNNKRGQQQTNDIEVFMTPVQPMPPAPTPSSDDVPLSSKPRSRTGPRFTKPPALEEEEIQVFVKPPPATSFVGLTPLAVGGGGGSKEESEEEPDVVIASAQSPARRPPSIEMVTQPPRDNTAPAAAAEEEEEEDFSLMSVEERASSSKWKARQSAYLEIGKSTKYDVLLDKAIDTETNPANLDVLLETMILRVQQSDEARPGKWIPALAKRCFTGRPSVAQRSVDLVIELFACDPPEQVAAALVAELASKNAKVVVHSLKCIRTACSLFGANTGVVPMQCILKSVELGMSAIPPATRAEASALAMEAISWLGEDFVLLLSSKLASDTQRRDLERKISEEKRPNNNEKKQPTRFRREASNSTAAASAAAGGGSNAANVGGGDLFDLLPAADIIPRLDRAPIEFEKRSNHHDWKVRKAVLEEVEQLCGKPPKLVTSQDYSHLVNGLKKIIANDANHAVLVQALNLLFALSEGLRTSFAFLAKISLVVLLEKYRDQKLVPAVDQVLDSYCHWSFQIGDDRTCVQIGETLSHAKCTPLQLLYTVKWIERAVSTYGKQRSPSVDFEGLRALIRQYAVTHRNPNVRQAANSALNALKDGASIGLPQQVNKPAIKHSQPTAPPPPAAAAPKPSLQTAKPPAAAAPAATMGRAVHTARFAPTSAPFDLVVIPKLASASPAFGFALAESRSNESVLKPLFDAVQDWDADFTHEEMEEVARFVGSKTREWTDPAMFTPYACDVLLAMLDRAADANLPDYLLSTVLPNVVMFHQATVLIEFATVIGPAAALHRVCKQLRAMQPTKAKLFVLEWCANCLRAFDLLLPPSAPAADLDEFCKLLAQEHTHAVEEQVKQACMAVWFELCKQTGEPQFHAMVTHILPSPLILEVVRKVHIAARSRVQQQQHPKEIWRFQPTATAAVAFTSPAPPVEHYEQESELLATEDVCLQIDRLLPILQTTEAAQWKKREEAFEQLELLLQHPISASSKTVHNLAAVLCKRLDDAQRNLAARAATSIGMLCACIGPSGSATILKQCIGHSLLHNLSDRKPQISSACNTALTLAVLHQGQVSLQALLQVMTLSLEVLHKNKIDKVKFLTWLADRLNEVDQQALQAQQDGMEDAVDILRNVFLDYVPVLLVGFTAKEAQAKRACVRIAEIIVSFIPEQLAHAKFRSGVRDLKYADQRLVDPLVEEVMRRGQASARARKEGSGEYSQPASYRASPTRLRPASPVSSSSRTSSTTSSIRPTSPPMHHQQQSRLNFVSPHRRTSNASQSITPASRPSYPSPVRSNEPTLAIRASTPPRHQQQVAIESARSVATTTSLALYAPPSHAKFERQLQMMISNIIDFEQSLGMRADDLPFPQSRDMLLLTRLETSIQFMQTNLQASPSPMEIDEQEWERLVEDMLSAAVVLNSFDMSLKHLISSSAADMPWRLGAWQGKVARLCLLGAVALTSKRSIRISLETESFTLTLIQLHPLAARDDTLMECVEATFRSIRETNSWLPTVLSLRDEPAEFVKRQVRDFCLEQQRAESPFFFVNLEECFDLVAHRDNHWVDQQVMDLFRKLLNGETNDDSGGALAVASKKRAEEDATLKQIFQRIITALEHSKTEECRQGIEDLRKFKSLNEELFAMLDPMVYLEGTAPLFQEYILDKLKTPVVVTAAAPLQPQPPSSPQPIMLQPRLPSTPSSEIKKRLEQMRNRSQLRMLTTMPIVPLSFDEVPPPPPEQTSNGGGGGGE